MPLLLTFLLGIGNFTMHKAVLESRHPLLGRLPWLLRGLNGRLSLALEFALLFAALTFAAQGNNGAVVAYGLYTGANGLAAWLILTGRI